MNFANHRDDRQPPPVPVVSPTGVWAHLIRLDGEEKHARIIELRGEEFRLGRRGDVDCMLHDPRISTKQLTFRYLDGRVTVQDSSSNGTCLNEDPFKGKTREIFHGDVIKFFQRVPLLSYRFDVNFKTQSMLTFESAAISAQAEAGNLSDYYLSDELSDVRIVVKYGDREQVDFPAHKLVIFAQSPVMKAMLSQPFQEKFENRIFLTDIEPEIVQALLFFMYKRQLLLNPEPIGVGLDGLATEPLSQSQLTTVHTSPGVREPTVASSAFSVPTDSAHRSRGARGTALTPAKRSSSGGGFSSNMPSKKRRKTPARQPDAMQLVTPNNKRSMSNEPMYISQTQSTHPDLDDGDQRSRSTSRAPMAMSRSPSRGQVHQRSNGHTAGRSCDKPPKRDVFGNQPAGDIMFLFQLLISADRYDIVPLRRLCSLRIIADLTIHTAGEVALMTHNGPGDLMQIADVAKIWHAALDFIVAKMPQFMKTPIFDRVFDNRDMRRAIMESFVHKHSQCNASDS